MTGKTAKELVQEHEEFKSRLLEDVFGKGNKEKVHMEKVTMLIWQFRDDPSVVNFMAQFVARFAGSRDTFDGIEFYLPQLSHMIIHLEADWDDAILERFALIVSQQSPHFALQFNWILQGALEDYQPETATGDPNPAYNQLFYSRCVKLLGNMERCVVYGSPQAHELKKMFDEGKVSREEYEMLEEADRRFNAAEITSRSSASEADKTGGFGGVLWYKRHVRTAPYKRKPWKTRYFLVSERMLYCYNVPPSQGGHLCRAMPLEGAEVMPSESTKYDHMFEVHNQNFMFRMRAESEEDKFKWMDVLKAESESKSLDSTHDIDGESSTASSSGIVNIGQGALSETTRSDDVCGDLTPSQLSRYDFYKKERDFVRSLCDVAEDLRAKERDERKKLAPGLMEELEIPPCAYIPLCNSTDVWRRVHSVMAKDTKVFNTNERCPIMMFFVTKRGEQMHQHRKGLRDENLDVAEYLHLQYQVPDPPATIGEVDEEEEEMDEPVEPDVVYPDSESNGANGDSEHSKSSSATLLWKEEGDSEGKQNAAAPSPQKGNGQIRKFVKDNLARMPTKIANRLDSKRNLKKTALDNATLPLQSVPIVENREVNDDEQSVNSVGSGSIHKQGGVLLAGDEGDGIDKDSVDKAKDIVTGGETWSEKSARMLKEYFEGSDLMGDTDTTCTEIVGLIAKSNDDLRQEVFVMQMIHYYKSVFAKASLPLWLRTYRILSLSKSTGLIELITDATSLDALKKAEKYPEKGGLRAYFEQVYGPPESSAFKAAQRNFMQSLAGYAIVSYLLGLKDRHNGNIMIDIHGRLIFIDFGFAMGMAPGHEFSMERAPFKFTPEYLEVMDGPKSECFAQFKDLFLAGFEAARKNSQVALGLVEIMMYKSNFPCFTGSRYGNGVALKRFEKRLMLDLPDDKARKGALKLVEKSLNHTGTNLYDKFQKYSNGYAV